MYESIRHTKYIRPAITKLLITFTFIIITTLTSAAQTPELWYLAGDKFYYTTLETGSPSFLEVTNGLSPIPTDIFNFSPDNTLITYNAANLAGNAIYASSSLPASGEFTTVLSDSSPVKIAIDNSGKTYYIDVSGKNLYVANESGTPTLIEQRSSDNFVNLTLSCNYLYVVTDSNQLIRYPLNNLSGGENGYITVPNYMRGLAYFNDRLYLFDIVTGNIKLIYGIESQSWEELPILTVSLTGTILSNARNNLVGYHVSQDDHLFVSNHNNNIYSISISGYDSDSPYGYSSFLDNPITPIDDLKLKYPLDCDGGPPPAAACGDNLDNDGDGLIDYPEDPGCSSNADTNEYNAEGNDYCPDDPLKTTPGKCGCGIPEDSTDSDGDYDKCKSN